MRFEQAQLRSLVYAKRLERQKVVKDEVNTCSVRRILD